MKARGRPKKKRRGRPRACDLTVQQKISKPLSESSVKGLAGRLRSLSVVLSDISKEKDLLTHQGWQSVGHGVWKLKHVNFQQASRYVPSKKKTDAFNEEKSVSVTHGARRSRRLLSAESDIVVIKHISKNSVDHEKHTVKSSDSSPDVVEGPLNKQPSFGTQKVEGDEAGIGRLESNLKNNQIQKSIKVNLSREKIGNSGEMGWRVTRRDSFQRDSSNSSGRSAIKRLSFEQLESDSRKHTIGNEVENKGNSIESLVSFSLGCNQMKETSNEVLVESLKRRRGCVEVHSTQDLSLSSHTRKSRRVSIKNSTKEKENDDRPNNEMVRKMSNREGLVASYSTNANSCVECPKDPSCSDSSKSSKVRIVDISDEPKTLGSTRVRSSNTKTNNTSNVPTSISSHQEKGKIVVNVIKLEDMNLNGVESTSISLNLRNKINLRSQKSHPMVKSTPNKAKSEIELRRESNLKMQSKNMKSMNVHPSANLLVKKEIVQMKKQQNVSRSEGVGMHEKRQKILFKKEIGKKKVNVKKESKEPNSVKEDVARVPRKRSNKVQLEWCRYCGLQLDSVENRLEHEFTHQEPRQLRVSVHLCSLNSTSVKLPIYVDLDEVAALKSPPLEDNSPDKNESPLYDIANVINEDEYAAYDHTSKEENVDEDCNQEGSVLNNDVNISAVSDSCLSEINDVKMTSRKTKEKVHGKMRLWVKSQCRSTRSSSRSEKQRIKEDGNDEECPSPSSMAADFIPDDILPAEDGVHEYVEVVVEKSCTERVIVDDEVIKDTGILTADQGNSESSKTSTESSPIEKNIDESFREETIDSPKENEEELQSVASLGVENSDINSNAIVLEEHDFRMQESERPGCSESFVGVITEKTKDNTELKSVEGEGEIDVNVGQKLICEISNEIDEDDVRHSDPKLSEINNDNLEDEMEVIESDLCKVDCGNIEDDIGNLNANFREMNDGIVGEIIGLDPNENDLGNNTMRNKMGTLELNTSEIEHGNIVDNNEDKTLSTITTKVMENTVENELESLDRKLTEINNQQDEEEHESSIVNRSNKIKENINQDQKLMDLDDGSKECVNLLSDLSEQKNVKDSGDENMGSTLPEPKSNDVEDDLGDNPSCGMQNKDKIVDSQSGEKGDVCTNSNKESKEIEEGELENVDEKQKVVDPKSDVVEDNLKDNLLCSMENEDKTDDSQSGEKDDVSTNSNKESEEIQESELENVDGEPKTIDPKSDVVEDNTGGNLSCSMQNEDKRDYSQGGEEADICTNINKESEEHEESKLENSDRKPTESVPMADVEDQSTGMKNELITHAPQIQEANDCDADLNQGNVLEFELKDSNGEPKVVKSKTANPIKEIEDNSDSASKKGDFVDSQSHVANDICSELKQVIEHKSELVNTISEKNIADSQVADTVNDFEDISEEEDGGQKEKEHAADNEVDSLEDISDGEFELVDEKNPAENCKDDSKRGSKVEKVSKSLEELPGDKKIDRAPSTLEGNKSTVVKEENSESVVELTKSPDKVQAHDAIDDDDDDDKDTVILDNENLGNTHEVEEFIRLRECQECEEESEGSRGCDHDERERNSNVTTVIENTDDLGKSSVSLLKNISDEGSKAGFGPKEGEGSESLSITVSNNNLKTLTAEMDDSVAVKNENSESTTLKKRDTC